MKKLDLTGQTFGRLLVMGEAPVQAKQTRWHCRCACGVECVRSGGGLRNGRAMSCGCHLAERMSELKTKHGMYGTPTYKSWSSMLTRCLNETNRKFPDYGGRGIAVCDRWKDFSSFFADMGIRPTGTTLGRVDNDGNYEPNNCEWQTATSQARNKRNTASFEYQGINATVIEHCERLEISNHVQAVKNRLYTYGWSVDRSFSQPFRSH